MRGRLLQRLPRWDRLPARDLLAVLYSMLVDDASGPFISRAEAMEEVDRVLHDIQGASEAEIRRTWGVDQRAEQQLHAATEMFQAGGR